MVSVHVPDGFINAGARVRATCSCGWCTTPERSPAAAEQVLAERHGRDRLICSGCRTARPRTGPGGVPLDLTPCIDLRTGSMALFCHDCQIVRAHR